MRTPATSTAGASRSDPPARAGDGPGFRMKHEQRTRRAHARRVRIHRIHRMHRLGRVGTQRTRRCPYRESPMKFRTSRMATIAIPLIALLGAAAASQVQAQTHIATQTEGEDPHAPVYVVASRATYLAGLQEVASDGLA